MPRELIGTWERQARGDALDVIVFLDPARFKRAEVLTRQRETGLFEFSIASRGTARATFSAEAKHTLVVMSATSLGVQLASLEGDDAAAVEAATALSSRARGRLVAVDTARTAMSLPPTVADGVDRSTAEVVNARPADWERFSAVQRQSADHAHVLGLRAGLLSPAIFLAALVGSCGDHGQDRRRPPWTSC